MERVKALMSSLLDTSLKKIQCSNEKNIPSVYRTYEESLDYNFVRFGNKYFIPALSLDIDNHQNLKIISNILKSNKLPTPNIIVTTSKGLHIHWVLSNPISTNNVSQLALYQHIANELIKLFGSDKNAMPKRSGRMFRNPLKHPTTYFTSNTITLEEFKHIIPEQEKVKEGTSRKKKVLRYKTPDFSQVKVGERNQVLFDFGRHVAYKHGNEEGLTTTLETAINYANSKIPESLSLNEVNTIVTSIEHFMRTRFTSKTKNKRTIEFNRKLAKRQAELKQTEMLKKWVATGVLTIKKLRNISMREGGRILGVHKNTFGKHREFLINAIKNLTILFKKPINHTQISGDGFFTMNISSLLHNTQFVEHIRCTSPPLLIKQLT